MNLSDLETSEEWILDLADALSQKGYAWTFMGFADDPDEMCYIHTFPDGSVCYVCGFGATKAEAFLNALEKLCFSRLDAINT